MRPVYLFLLSVLAFGGVLFSINDVSAIVLPPPPITVFPVAGDTLQMVCTVPGIGEGNIATVTAGDGTPGPTFPVIVTCPGAGCPGGPTVPGQYARWDFSFDYTGEGGSRTALLQVAADVTIEATNPPGAVLNPGDETLLNGNLNDFDSKWIRFAATSDPFAASYYTKTNFIPRIEGVAAKKGLFNFGKCRLAGTGTRSGSGAEAVSLRTEVQAGPCTFSKTVDGRGCTTNLEVTSGNPGICVFSNETLALSNNPAFPLDPGTKCQDVQISFKGSCKYCYPTSSGALKCITDTSVVSCPK